MIEKIIPLPRRWPQISGAALIMSGVLLVAI